VTCRVIPCVLAMCRSCYRYCGKTTNELKSKINL